MDSDLWLLLYYVIGYGAYTVSFICFCVVAFLVLKKKPLTKGNKVTIAVLGTIGILAFSYNFALLRSFDINYQIQQRDKRYQDSYKAAAKFIDFPTYRSNEGLQETAEVSFRHPPIFVLYSIKNEGQKLTMYQYKTGTKPYTLYQLKDGSCDNNPICTQVTSSSFGPVYKVRYGLSDTNPMYFSTNGQTNLFIRYEAKIGEAEVIDFLNSLKEIEPSKLPF